VDELDSRVRLAAFRFLAEQTLRHPESLPYDALQRGFEFEGRRVPLLGPQGIFKPAILADMPLSICTVPTVEGRPRPYEDEIGPDNLIRYRYRGTDPEHRDNVGLRLALRRRAPLVYLHGIVPGRYVAAWPVYVVGDDPRHLVFTVAVDERERALVPGPGEESSAAEVRRAYVTVTTLRRLHQHAFRERILLAYREQCAVCRFRHRELLEAAHILPDGHPRGEPVVPNGLALCSLHHAAFDRHLLGIRPDLTVELRLDLLREKDGPTLQHGLIGFQGRAITVPRRPDSRPNPDFLAERYELFRKAG
jgi:putative restriction endonuclease